MLTSSVNGCWILGTTTEVGSPLGITSSTRTSVPLIMCPIFGTVLMSRFVLTFGLSYTKDIVAVRRGQQMSIRTVVFRTWVHVLIMCLCSPFKRRPFVLFFGMPCKEPKLFFCLIFFVDVISDPCREMRTSL